MVGATHRFWFNRRRGKYWREYFRYIHISVFLIKIVPFFGSPQIGWNLYTESFVADMRLRILAWDLYTRVCTLGHTNFIFAMATRYCGCSIHRDCADHCAESSLAEFQQIDDFNWLYSGRTLSPGRRIHASLFPRTIWRCTNDISTFSVNSQSRCLKQNRPNRLTIVIGFEFIKKKK